MKVYISGAITGVENYKEKFAEAECLLRAQGHEVINPSYMDLLMPESTTHQEYMKVSLVLLEMCDVIYLLEGWQDSKGARLELEYAREMGLTIVEEGEME